MSRLSTNVLLNYGGTLSTGLVYLILVPVYVRLLGLHGYGLIGLLNSIDATLRFMDFGLTLGISREVARFASRERVERVLGLGAISYGVVVILTLLVMGGLGLWSDRLWPSMPNDRLFRLLWLFGAVLALRWIIVYCYAVLRGFEAHKRVNTSIVIGNAARLILSVAFLSQIQSSPLLAVLALLAANIVEVLLAIGILWRETRHRAIAFVWNEFSLFREVFAFSGYVTLSSVAAGVLKNLDKILLSFMVSFSALGAYQAAWTGVQAISSLIGPILVAAYPRLSRNFQQGDEAAVALTYHRITSTMLVIAIPFALGGAAFSVTFLRLLTGSDAAGPLVSGAAACLFVAAFFNAAMQASYILQVAAGHPWIGAMTNSAAVLLLTPIYYLAIRHFGVTGAGLGWLAFNILYFLIIPNITHRFLLPQEKGRWFVQTCGRPMLAGLLAFAPAAILSRFGGYSLAQDIAIGAVAALLYGVLLVLVVPDVRIYLAPYLKRLR